MVKFYCRDCEFKKDRCRDTCGSYMVAQQTIHKIKTNERVEKLLSKQQRDSLWFKFGTSY